MSDPNSADRTDLPTELEREPAPDMLAELGPLAYGLFALSARGPLTEVRSLADSRAGQVPAQAARTPEREDRQDALLGELGELDL
jgi:hypothetical protein